MLTDSHVHVNDKLFLQSLISNKVAAILNAANPLEFKYLKPYQENKHIYISAGIHPWDVDTITWEMMIPILNECSIIGEIGMDSVWCSTSLTKQQEIFEKQLSYASKTRKPVILHTKGQEKKVLECIKKYPNTYLVHWYSCMDYLEEYLKLNSYFTVGPELTNLAVVQVIKKVPLNRLLSESDGMSAIAWVKGKEKISFEEYYQTLKETCTYVALEKGCSIEEVQKQIRYNLHCFIEGRY